MSDSFDAEAIRDNSERRREIEEAAALNKRLIDCEFHYELYAVLDKLKDVPGHKHKRPSATIDEPTTVYVYGKDGKQNLRLKQTLDTASVKYSFPDGLTVTNLRKSPLTFRLDDKTGRQLIIRRKRDTTSRQLFWEIMSPPAGFKQHRGKHAGFRRKGKSADRSFD